MIVSFSKNILKFGRIQPINTGKYNVINANLTINTPKSFISISKQESLFKLPADISKYEKDFKLDETISNPVHDLVKPGKEKIIGYWLLITAAGVFGMILLGGYTRLSNSGLSMTKWKPIDHLLPQNEEEWQKEFDNYKQYPEYQLVNKNMDLKGFKKIFFVEWAHRLWGSQLGFLFSVPLISFISLGWIKKPMLLRLIAMLGFGGLQGLIGWWMVKSGFEQKPDYQTKPRVSVYRLFVHLNMAIILYSALLWNGLTLIRRPQQQTLQLQHLSGNKTMRGLGIGLLHFIALNIMSGSIVAGIDAGKGFNTWPYMNDQIIPDGLMKRSPWYQNFFENKVLVQFNHRNFAYLTSSWTIFMVYKSLNLQLARYQNFSILLLFSMIVFQFINGINTLINGAPLRRASEHQASALVTLSIAIYSVHSFRRPSKQYYKFVQNYIKQKQIV